MNMYTELDPEFIQIQSLKINSKSPMGLLVGFIKVRFYIAAGINFDVDLLFTFGVPMGMYFCVQNKLLFNVWVSKQFCPKARECIQSYKTAQFEVNSVLEEVQVSEPLIYCHVGRFSNGLWFF